MTYFTKHIFLCTNQKGPGKQCCANTGGEIFVDYLKKKVKGLDLPEPLNIRVSKSGCLGRCTEGPCIVIYPEGIWYTYASLDDLDEIVTRYLINGDIVERLLINS